MKPDLKQRWLDALRSGEYQQGVHYLKKNVDGQQQYCCLGVLCEIAGKKLVPGGHDDDDETIPVFGVRTKSDNGRYQTDSQVPADKTLKELGLDRNVATYLAELNDDGSGFETIASLIEGVSDLDNYDNVVAESEAILFPLETGD